MNLLTMKDAAAQVGVDYRTMRRWVRSRRVRHIRLGVRSIRIPADAITKMLEKSTVPSRIPGG